MNTTENHADGGDAEDRRQTTSEVKNQSAQIDVRNISIGRQSLTVAIRRGSDSRPPLLLFNGIGANWELARPFFDALTDTTAIIFDVPGVGGSAMPALPYRPSTLARLASRLVAELGYKQVDVAGVSWGGGLAQQFAHQYPFLCRRLVLAATSPGAIMVPGRLSVLWKMATPRRYTDKEHMRKVAPQIYGGVFRKHPELIAPHANAMHGGGHLGYLYQQLAMAGWTSLPWLWLLRQPTLVLVGSDDPLIPPINGEILARLIPNSRLRTIDDGHLFLVTRPAESAAIIEEFLSAAEPQRDEKPSWFARNLTQVARRISGSADLHHRTQVSD